MAKRRYTRAGYVKRSRAVRLKKTHKRVAAPGCTHVRVCGHNRRICWDATGKIKSNVKAPRKGSKSSTSARSRPKRARRKKAWSPFALLPPGRDASYYAPKKKKKKKPSARRGRRVNWGFHL